MTTPHKHAALIKAWADGATIEMAQYGQMSGELMGWKEQRPPYWHDDAEYRIKAEALPNTMTDNTQAVEAAAFRKKPVTIHAVQWDGTYSHAKQLEAALGLNTLGMTSNPPNNTCSWWKIATLEDGHVVSPLDWIITGVKGEHYPCKPDVFEMTYEPASQQEVAAEGEDVRERFEHWARTQAGDDVDLGGSSFGVSWIYNDHSTQMLWTGYRAAASRPPAGVGVDASVALAKKHGATSYTNRHFPNDPYIAMSAAQLHAMLTATQAQPPAVGGSGGVTEVEIVGREVLIGTRWVRVNEYEAKMYRAQGEKVRDLIVAADNPTPKQGRADVGEGG